MRGLVRSKLEIISKSLVFMYSNYYSIVIPNKLKKYYIFGISYVLSASRKCKLLDAGFTVTGTKCLVQMYDF